MNAATELHQFFKLPALLEHYRDHQRENPALSLLDFLKLHYTPHHPNDGDQREDEQLPFKSAGTLSHIDMNWIPAAADPSPGVPVTGRLYSVPPCEETIRRSYGIFHPPRQV